MSADSGIERPEDLAGKRVGVPEYQMTAPVWIRGILDVDRIGAGKTLAAMLAEGRLDALHTARTPSSFYSRADRVRRLFSDFKAVEQD